MLCTRHCYGLEATIVPSSRARYVRPQSQQLVAVATSNTLNTIVAQEFLENNEVETSEFTVCSPIGKENKALCKGCGLLLKVMNGMAAPGLSSKAPLIVGCGFVRCVHDQTDCDGAC